MIKFIFLLFLLMPAVCAKAKIDHESDKHSHTLQRVDSVVKKMNIIEDAVIDILLRKEIKLKIPKAEIPNDSSRAPSSIAKRVSRIKNKQSSKNIDTVLIEFFKDAKSGAPIQSTYESGCTDNWKENAEITTTDRSIYSDPVATQLDAVAFISFLECDINQLAKVNNPSAKLPSRTNSKLIANTLLRERIKVLNKPFRVDASELHLITIGQVFRFASTNDKDIPVPDYVSQLLLEEIVSLTNIFRPITINPLKQFSFNRYDIPDTDGSIQESPMGWFNGIASDGVVYVSPTFARAAVLACVSKIEYLPAIRNRLIETDLPLLVSGKLTDMSGTITLAEKMVQDMNICIKRQATFLLGHELAHQVVKVGEGHAWDANLE